MNVLGMAIFFVAGLTACSGTAPGSVRAERVPAQNDSTIERDVVADAATEATDEVVATDAAEATVATAEGAASLTPSSSGANPFGGNAPEDFLMPLVICMNLQQAQDEIQDHGVFFSRSEDATGQSRMQVNDSNWQVIAQYPAEMSPIGEGDVVLSVVKYGEQPNPC